VPKAHVEWNFSLPTESNPTKEKNKIREFRRRHIMEKKNRKKEQRK
jgi:hypothetical protein